MFFTKPLSFQTIAFKLSKAKASARMQNLHSSCIADSPMKIAKASHKIIEAVVRTELVEVVLSGELVDVVLSGELIVVLVPGLRKN